jgi:hypothetical protein
LLFYVCSRFQTPYRYNRMICNFNIKNFTPIVFLIVWILGSIRQSPHNCRSCDNTCCFIKMIFFHNVACFLSKRWLLAVHNLVIIQSVRSPYSHGSFRFHFDVRFSTSKNVLHIVNFLSIAWNDFACPFLKIHCKKHSLNFLVFLLLSVEIVSYNGKIKFLV